MWPGSGFPWPPEDCALPTSLTGLRQLPGERGAQVLPWSCCGSPLKGEGRA